MDTERQSNTFVDSLSADMTKEQFIDALRGVITDDDRKIFGPNYEDQLIQLVLYPAVFAPFPATFDSNAIAGIVDDFGAADLKKTQNPTLDLEHTNTIIDRTMHVASRSVELGVLELNDEGRFFIRPEVANKLKPILDKFEEEE